MWSDDDDNDDNDDNDDDNDDNDDNDNDNDDNDDNDTSYIFRIINNIQYRLQREIHCNRYTLSKR